MTSKKKLLNDLLDIGGVATLNNLYQPSAKTYKGAMKRVRINKDLWLNEKLVEVLLPYPSFRSEFPAREVFYGITKKGAKFIDREEDFTNRKVGKSADLENTMHESAKFDICLSFVRLFPKYDVTIDFWKIIGKPKGVKGVTGGIKPDATIYLNLKTNPKIRHVFYVEIERKKTVSRTFSEKILRYQEVLNRPNIFIPQPFKVLVVFFSRDYSSFLRPQEMTGINLESANRVREMVKDLATNKKYGATLPDYYRFMAQPDFYRLNETVCYKKDGSLVTPLN